MSDPQTAAGDDPREDRAALPATAAHPNDPLRSGAAEQGSPESGSAESHSPESGSHEPGAHAFGALEIVEAFTALRHELKLQVRDGRQLREATVQGLARLEQTVAELASTAGSTAAPAAAPSAAAAADDSARQLAEAVSEIEEALQRAVEALRQVAQPEPAPLAPRLQNALQRSAARLPRFKRWLLGGAIEQLAADLQQQLAVADPPASWATAVQGLELLLVRVHRLMQRCELQRLDVTGLAFDPERMQAVEVVQSGSSPSGHVARQLRPAYLWRSRVLRAAEVQVEK